MFKIKFKIKQRKVLIPLIILIFFALIVFLFNYHTPSGLEVYFFNVGQGDACLVKTPDGSKILIDGGPDDTILTKLAQQLSWIDRDIDLVISTHSDSDHLFGLNEVLHRYHLDYVIMTGDLHNTPLYKDWLTQINQSKVLVKIIDHSQKIIVDDVVLDILYPQQNLSLKQNKDSNNNSIVFKLEYKGNAILFMGDLETLGEKELLNTGVDLSAQILKVGHHGSKNATSSSFLQKVHPKLAIISVGEKNNFNQPSQLIIKRLENIGAKVLQTTSGDIHLFFDQQGNYTFDIL